ncbi:MAG: hypothetical protein JWP92_3726 [Caulobacter sp.]|nr:hypothetical protein [Caulobacter sp.]
MTDSTRTRFAKFLRSAATFVRGAFDARDLVGFAGVGLVAYGFGQIYRPAGFIVLGGLLLVGVFLSARTSRK